MGFETAILTEIEASVYYGDLAKDKYFLKISFIGLGIYANSFLVQPTKFDAESKWWVQPPKHKQGSKWTATIDFDKTYPLWAEIEKKAVDAVELYKREQPTSIYKKDMVYNEIPDEISLESLGF